MGTIVDKFNYTFEAKELIKQKTNDLGGNLTDESELKDYADELGGIYDRIPKISGENTEVTLNPTLKGKLGIVEKGNSTQEQQKSPNLFNINDGLTFVGVVSGTLNSDESISYTYDNSSGSTTANLQVYTNNLNIQASTEYSVIAEIISISGTGTFYVTNRNSGSNQGQFQNTSYAFSSLHNGDILVNKLTSITSENMATVTRGLRTLVAFSSGQSGSITFRISVLADTTITPQTFHYLPYGMLNPQPYFPIPIKSVTGNNNVVVNSANWFSSEMEVGGINADGTNNNGASNTIRTKNFISVLPNTQYYIANDKAYANYVYEYDKDNNFISAYTGTTYYNAFSFTTKSNTKYIRVRGIGNQQDLTIKYMLNLGNTAQTWVAYQNQTLPLNLGTIELNKIGNYQDYIYKTTGKNLINQVETNKGTTNDGTITSANTAYLGINEYMSCLPNTTYAVTLQHDNASAILYVSFKDSNGNFISRISYSTARTFTTPSNAYSMFFYLNKSGVTWETVGGYVQVEYGSTPTVFNPYGSGKWYKKEEVKKEVLDSTYFNEKGTTGTNAYYISITTTNGLNDNSVASGICNMFGNVSFSNRQNGLDVIYVQGGRPVLRTKNNTSLDWSTNDNCKNWLNANNPIIYYVLATPTDTEITNTDLINQLEAIDKMKSYNGTTIITSTFESSNAQMIINGSALKGE